MRQVNILWQVTEAVIALGLGTPIEYLLSRDHGHFLCHYIATTPLTLDMNVETVFEATSHPII